jgi:hypothetical protein
LSMETPAVSPSTVNADGHFGSETVEIADVPSDETFEVSYCTSSL